MKKKMTSETWNIFKLIVMHFAIHKRMTSKKNIFVNRFSSQNIEKQNELYF